MSMHRRHVPTAPHRSALLATLLLALPLAGAAQTAPASSSTSSMGMGSMPRMDHGSMPGMTMPATASSSVMPATKPPARKPRKKSFPAPSAPASHDRDGMKGMDQSAMSGMDHDAMPEKGQDDMAGMGPMQGGSPPTDARSPDYSGGVSHGSMKGMDMADNAPLGMLLINQLETFHGRDANGQSWEAEGWYGNDENKLWVRTEGERSRGKQEDGDVEAFWNHDIATFWSTQLGVRQELGEGPNRSWAAFGVQGLAPHWFEVEATGYLGASGRTAARLRVDYEMLLTQRLILQPETEINLYGNNDPQRRLGSGVSDLQLGLRLRYEIRRQFAPYIGVNWVRRVGTTADYARQDHHPVLDRQIVAGVRIWF